MSRVGKVPVALPEGVKAALSGDILTLEGPAGKADLPVHPAVSVSIDETARRIVVALREATGINAREARKRSSMWGTTQRLIGNMIEGVTKGYTQQLQVVGVGYGARLEAGTLVIRCGYANEMKVPVPPGIKVDPPAAGNVMISGIGQLPCAILTFHSTDKWLIGEFAASIRRLRPPEPYKGKGIRYMGEEIKRKAGKALAAGAK